MGTLRIVGRRGIMREKNKQIWIYVLLILGAIIMIIPFGWMIIVAFTKPDITYQMTLSNVINSLSLDHFRPLFTEYNILRYAANSIIVSVVSTAGQILICAMSGFVFARIDFKHKEKIFILYLATMMIPVQATVIPQYILINKMGLINTYAGLFLPGLFNAFGTFLMRQYFMGVPKALEEAACLDGAGYIRIFFQIMLPLAKTGLAVLAVTSFMGAWNDFLWPLLVASDDLHTTLPLFLSQLQGRWYVDWSVLMGATLISVLPILIVYLFAQRYFIEGVQNTGIK